MALDSDKARRAAAHPDRPGEQCRAPPGVFRPVIDHARCEGKRDCVEVCPYDVFEVRRLDDADFAALGFLAKVKSVARTGGRRPTRRAPTPARPAGCAWWPARTLSSFKIQIMETQNKSEFKVTGEELLAKIRELIHEGNVRKIIIKE